MGLIVKPDNTYVVQIDGKEKASGSLEEDWKFLEPKQIKDPEKSKPSDWVDEKRIPDESDVKPEGYDDIPEMIPDPDYIGEWEHPMVDNPDYAEDPEIYRACRDGCSHVGFELWQVKSGTIFDDILVTDDVSIAESALKEFTKKQVGQKKMEEEEKKKEEEAKKAAEGDEEDEADEHEEL